MSCSGARKYIVRVTSPENSEVVEAEAADNSQTIGGLLSGTLYRFSVFSVGKRNRRNMQGSFNASAATGLNRCVSLVPTLGCVEI